MLHPLVYGPIQSLRFGQTLGFNLLGETKVCSFDCGYCHLGATTLTMSKARKEYVYPTVDQVREAFIQFSAKAALPEKFVISGNGEPTLYPHLLEAVQMIKELRDNHAPKAEVLILTNGAHLDNRKTIQALNELDQRIVKVDVGQDGLLESINRPSVRLNLSKILIGLRKLKDCTAQSLFVSGPHGNTGPDAVDDWIEIVGMLKPKLVQLCTVTRPAHDKSVKAVDENTLYSIAFKLKKRTGIETQVFANELTDR